MATFLDELARLNTQNFMGGLTQIGEAVKEKRTNESVAGLYNEFAVRRSELMPRDQQLAEFNKELAGKDTDELTGDKINGVIDKITEATLNLDKIYQQTGAYESLYRPYITAFATLGDEGVKIANTLSRELDSKKELLEKQGQIPIKELEYQNALMDRASNRVQLMSNTIKLDSLKQDTEAINLMTNMLDNEIGKRIFTFDERTGKSNLKIDDIYNQLRGIYGTDPAFGKAWLLLENHLYKNLQNYRSPEPKELSGGRTPTEKLGHIVNAYSVMESMSRRRGQLLYDREEPNKFEQGRIAEGKRTNTSNAWIREAYLQSAEQLGKEIDPESIGADLQVISNIEDSAAKKELQWVYDHFYNTTNPENYWNYMKVFKEQLRNPITGELPKIGIDSPRLALEGLPVPIDLTKILTQDGGEYDPYQMPIHMTQITRAAVKAERQKQKTKQNVQNLEQQIQMRPGSFGSSINWNR